MAENDVVLGDDGCIPPAHRQTDLPPGTVHECPTCEVCGGRVVQTATMHFGSRPHDSWLAFGEPKHVLGGCVPVLAARLSRLESLVAALMEVGRRL